MNEMKIYKGEIWIKELPPDKQEAFTDALIDLVCQFGGFIEYADWREEGDDGEDTDQQGN